MTQQLFLELSTGPIPSPHVVAVNLDTIHIASLSDAVAVWIWDQEEPLYFPHGSEDAKAIEAWAATQLGEQFLFLPPAHLFNRAHIADHEPYGDKIIIEMTDIGSFGITATAATVAAYHRWTSDPLFDDTQPRPVAVLV